MLDIPFFRRLLSFPLTPLPLFWLLLCISGVLQWRNKHKLARITLYVSLCWFATISTSILPNLLIDSLEKKYLPLTDISSLPHDSVLYIMVLGAGHNNNPVLQTNNQLVEAEIVRLVEGIRLHRILPKSKIITSGRNERQPESQAATVRKAAIELGVLPEQIDTLSQTTNTMDEASNFRDKFGKGKKVIVVTDAYHMPRAMLWFKKMGLSPIAAPTNHILKEEKSKRKCNLIPSSTNITKMEVAMHEYLGMLWAWMILKNNSI